MTQYQDVVGEVVGYARVSTEDQDLKAQIVDLENSGVPRHMIFSEKVSGAARKLPQRALALKMVARPGWTLRVTKLDRLGRSMRDVVNIAHEIEEAGAFIHTLDGVNTRDPITGRLLLQMLAVVAEFERMMIASRTKRGMAQRKADGATFGAKKKITAKLRLQIRKDLRAKDREGRLLYSLPEVARRAGISAGTINNDAEFASYRTRVLKVTKRGRPRKQAVKPKRGHS